MAATLDFTLGDRLRKAREYAGLSSIEIAKELGVSRNTVTNYERHPGKRGVPHAVVRVWADITGVDLDWLTSEEDDVEEITYSDPIAA